MSWHIYPYGLGLDRGGAIPDALVVFIYDEKETPCALAEDWAGCFPDAQFSFLAVDTGMQVLGQSGLERLVNLINWELAWTGLWHDERLVLVGLGIGSHIALRLASKCSSCAGVIACGAKFSLGDPAGVLAHIPVRLIRCTLLKNFQAILPFEHTILHLRRQNADFEAVSVDAAPGEAENVISRLVENYLSDLLSAAGAAKVAKARGHFP